MVDAAAVGAVSKRAGAVGVTTVVSPIGGRWVTTPVSWHRSSMQEVRFNELWPCLTRREPRFARVRSYTPAVWVDGCLRAGVHVHAIVSFVSAHRLCVRATHEYFVSAQRNALHTPMYFSSIP